jgi:hypothetical protein
MLCAAAYTLSRGRFLKERSSGSYQGLLGDSDLPGPPWWFFDFCFLFTPVAWLWTAAVLLSIAGVGAPQLVLLISGLSVYLCMLVEV